MKAPVPRPVSYTHLDVYKRQAQQGGISRLPCGNCGRKWRDTAMSKLLPYETIIKACEGDPEAVNAVLLHYAGYIRSFSKVNGQVNAEVEEII